MKKKFSIAVMALLTAVMIPISASASAGWDTLAEYDTSTYSYGVMTGVYHSGGGSYRICVSNIRSGNHIKVTLLNYDGGPLEVISSKTITTSGGCAQWDNLNQYVDGSNNKAEFNAKLESTDGTSDAIHVVIQD